jgi:hypothetical protein
MKHVLDVVNLNPDASCLESDEWINILNGPDKKFLAWLKLFVKNNSPVLFGICGSALADIKSFAPDAIIFMKDHPDIFHFTVRPFSHASSYLLTHELVELNLNLGIKAHDFLKLPVEDIFLPPEFMVTTFDLSLLNSKNIRSIFLNPARFNMALDQKTIRLKMKSQFKSIEGVLIQPENTHDYLKVLQLGNIDNEKNKSLSGLTVRWRDGESWMLLPDGLERESRFIEWKSQQEKTINCKDFQTQINKLKTKDIKWYPRHQLTKWTGSGKMSDVCVSLQSLMKKPNLVKNLPYLNKLLYAIGSDVLSSVEKDSVKVPLIDFKTSTMKDYLIERGSRHIEGEIIIMDLLQIANVDYPTGLLNKLEARESFLEKLVESNK